MALQQNLDSMQESVHRELLSFFEKNLGKPVTSLDIDEKDNAMDLKIKLRNSLFEKINAGEKQYDKAQKASILVDLLNF